MIIDLSWSHEMGSGSILPHGGAENAKSGKYPPRVGRSCR